jgi:hypothetical protein
LISGGVCVVDLSDIDNIGDDRYGGSYNVGNKQYSSKLNPKLNPYSRAINNTPQKTIVLPKTQILGTD